MKIKNLLFIILIISCKSSEKNYVVPERVHPNKDNITYVGKGTYSGYLYEYYQEKCPGTHAIGDADRCIRFITFLSREKLSDPYIIFKKGVLHIDKDMLIIMDSMKWAYNISNYQFEGKKISDLFPDAKSYEDSRYYKSSFFNNLKKEKDICNTMLKAGVRVTECVISDGVNGLEFSASNDLLAYTLSPYTGLATFGMPLELPGTSSNLL